MGKFPEGIKIPKYFGDFGGDYSERDTVAPGKRTRAEYLEALLSSRAFAEKLDACLQVILPQTVDFQTYTLADGRRVHTAPALSRYYILAGYLAITAFDKRDKAVMGTYSREMAVAFARACRDLNFGARVCLSRALSEDTGLLEQLKNLRAEIDDRTCLELFDAPYAYVNFDDAQGYSIVPVEANYGPYPQAALTGLLASLYGEDLKQAMGGELPECVAVAVTTGTEAVGTFSALINGGCALATVEETVAKEFHLEDSGCYTLSTRSADYDEPDTTICPQLAHWWRMGKVARLGCDRIFPVDTAFLSELPLSRRAARAVALAFEALDCRDVLVLEETK